MAAGRSSSCVENTPPTERRRGGLAIEGRPDLRVGAQRRVGRLLLAKLQTHRVGACVEVGADAARRSHRHRRSRSRRRSAARCRRPASRRPTSRGDAGCWRSSAARGSCGRTRGRSRGRVARSVVRTAVCSTISAGSGPRCRRANGVCSTGTKYGWAPSARVRSELEHLRPERGQDERHGRIRQWRGIRGRVHRVEVARICSSGLRVAAAA